MSLPFLPVVRAIRDVEESIAITDPVTLAVREAYLLFPSQQETAPNLPCFINSFNFTEVDTTHMMFKRELTATVDISFLVQKAGIEDELNAEIAVAFWDATFEAFCQDITLDGTATRALLRGQQPTLGIIERAGLSYVGFQAVLDIRMEEFHNWTPVE